MRIQFYDKCNVEGISFYGFYGIDLVSRDIDIHVVLEKERFDLLAYLYYGDPNCWWVIAEENKDFLPFLSYYTGKKIRIPKGAINNFVRTK